MLEGNPRTAIIYATGLEGMTISRQFSPNESGTLLEYVLDSVWTVADELIVVFNSEPDLSIVEAISPFGVKILTTPKGQSALMTVCSAFKSAKSEHCLLATEKVPLLKPNVALALFENALGYDLAIPKWKNGRTEPLLAVYRKKAFVRIASSGKYSGDLRSEVTSLVDKMFDIKYVSVDQDLAELDPELDSFLEVKDDKSLQKARSKASIRAKRIQKQVK